ncbi:uncharacterized protein [Coffea arabica]|uniref:Endonuclease/exonuclease/phosphatase domain-containing protein n=1 Tax=Coffea arabica TaxID=13443 RepID=A0A6P6TW31_COFAR|nr:uncharacterized protein LOC113704891 [Coffea arabica]
MPKWPVPSNVSTATFKLDIGILDHVDEEADAPDIIFDVELSDAITDSNDSFEFNRNCRGAANANFRRNLKEILREYDPSILILVETRTDSGKADWIVQSSQLTDKTCVETCGFSGGIWVLWNKHKWAVEVITRNRQVIHMLVKRVRGEEWMLSAVYASPDPPTRRSLWEYFSNIDKSINFPWMVVGDFNEVISSEEKQGGRPLGRASQSSLAQILLQGGLMDMDCSGPSLTWSNCRKGIGSVRKRLDRALCNNLWRAQFQEAVVKHMVRTHSDHHPLQVCLEGVPRRTNGEKPFRLEQAWSAHPEYERVVAEAWQGNEETLEKKLQMLRMRLKEWNLLVFGNIFHRKKRCKTRLEGV